MSLRIAPATAHPSSTSNLSSTTRTTATVPSAASAPGLPDPLSHSLSSTLDDSRAATAPHSATPAPTSAHPLEARLKQWRATQHALKMEGLRRAYGMAEPIRREMELKIVRGQDFRPALLGGPAGLAGDILEGKDASVDWEDVFTDQTSGERLAMLEERGGVAREVEGRLGMKF